MKMYPIKGSIDEAAEVGLTKGSRGLLKDARSRTPELTGRLKRSGRVRVEGLEATVNFTDAKAHIVHEDLDAKHPNGGEAKFLENAAIEYDVAADVAESIRGLLGG